MDKLTTGVAYGTSAGNAGFWALQLLDKVTPSQWAAIGVLGSLVFWPADVSDKSLFQD
ncbi:lysis protein S [Escherichia coli]|nr:lysis protein S [Escherichia coli]